MKKTVTLVSMCIALNAFSAASMADNSVSQPAKVQDVKTMAGHGNIISDSTKKDRKDSVQRPAFNLTKPATPGGVQTPAENNTWLYITVILVLVGGLYFAISKIRRKSNYFEN